MGGRDKVFEWYAKTIAPILKSQAAEEQKKFDDKYDFTTQ